MKRSHTVTCKFRVSATAIRIVIAGLIATHLQAFGIKADESPATLATVNGTPITESDLEFLYLSRDVHEELRPSVRKRYIEQLINRSLLKEFLLARNIKAPDSVIKDRVARAEKLITQEGLNFDETLKNLGYTRASFAE